MQCLLPKQAPNGGMGSQPVILSDVDAILVHGEHRTCSDDIEKFQEYSLPLVLIYTKFWATLHSAG